MGGEGRWEVRRWVRGGGMRKVGGEVGGEEVGEGRWDEGRWEVRGGESKGGGR